MGSTVHYYLCSLLLWLEVQSGTSKSRVSNMIWFGSLQGPPQPAETTTRSGAPELQAATPWRGKPNTIPGKRQRQQQAPRVQIRGNRLSRGRHTLSHAASSCGQRQQGKELQRRNIQSHVVYSIHQHDAALLATHCTTMRRRQSCTHTNMAARHNNVHTHTLLVDFPLGVHSFPRITSRPLVIILTS